MGIYVVGEIIGFGFVYGLIEMGFVYIFVIDVVELMGFKVMNFKLEGIWGEVLLFLFLLD